MTNNPHILHLHLHHDGVQHLRPMDSYKYLKEEFPAVVFGEAEFP